MTEEVQTGATGPACGNCGKCSDCRGERNAWVVAGAILLGSLVISASILVSMKPKGTGATVPDAALPMANTPTQPSGAAQPTTGTISLDDDPVLGNKAKAKVAIVEFSDYECPFCQKFHADTYDQLVKDFVDSGKAVYSFRDYPLPFHEPNASKAANLGQCVKEAKGDVAYFAFSKAYFAATQSNGKGLAAGKQDEILKALGVNVASVTQCATSEKFKDEIAKDMSDGQATGVSGTPSFIVGKLDANGNVTGELLVGAQPYAQFKATVEKYLQ